MRAITAHGIDNISLEQLEIPAITRPDEVLVRVRAAGICGSDVGVFHGKNPYAKYPVIMGHEGAGEVVEVGSGVTDLAPGDGVVFEPITYCGHCYACRTGMHNVCRDLRVMGVTMSGIFRDYAVVPRAHLFKFDTARMTYRQAALCEPYTIGAQANSRGGTLAGDLVLVHGAGPIGLIVADVARSRGARVIISEPNGGRRALAERFGIDYVVDPMNEDLDAFIARLTDGEGVNVIFDAAGVPAIIRHAVELLSPAGRFVPMTYGREPIPVDFQKINAKQLTILGTRLQYEKFPETVAWLPDHLDHVDMLTTHVFGADEFMKGFDTLADPASGSCKVVLDFS